MNDFDWTRWLAWIEPFRGWITSGVRIVLILVAAWLALHLLHRVVGSFRERVSTRMGDREAVKRAETLTRVVHYLISVVVTLIAGMLVLSELGISVAPILGAAGVVGLAVGFGAQSLVKDYFTGFFVLLENQIRQGDVVKLGEHAGFVEEVTLRYVQLRDYDGNVHIVPNGQITTVVNMSRSFAYAVVDARVALREDVDQVIEVIRRTGAALRSDPAFAERILDALDVAGVDRWEASGLIVRCRFKTLPLEQWAVRREFLRRLKAAFDEAGIEIPFPHLTLYAGQDRAGEAPPLPLRVARAERPPVEPAR